MPNLTKSETAGHAIVIGASIAGLLAARVLSRNFHQVTLIDRDRLPEGADQRSGVPQGFHGHALLARGHAELEKLFPGLDAELDAAGAPAGDALADTAILYRTGWLPRFRSGVASRACSRAFLEMCIRRRVLGIPEVRLMQGRQVMGLAMDASRRTVTGVRICGDDSDRKTSSPHETLSGDFVVDASGCTSRARQWLTECGYAAPRETVVDSLFGYASRRFEEPQHLARDWKVLIVSGRPPAYSRSGVIYPEEGGRWVVSLVGALRDYPPTDEVGFLEYARSLRSPLLYEAIRSSQPLSPIRGYRRLENRLRHYDRVSPWPEGFVVLGDAACAFNPMYGQGITVCALSAVALDECFQPRRGTVGRPRGLACRFQKRLAGVLAMPWLFATSEDARYLQNVVPRSLTTRLIHWYVDRAMSNVADQPYITQAFAEVLNLLQPPWRLLHPRIVAQVMRQTFSLARPRECNGTELVLGGVLDAGVVDAVGH